MTDSGYIRVRFILGRGLSSRLIAYVTGSLFSHVEFGTPNGTWIGAHLVGGVRERHKDYCKVVREYVYDLPCTLQQQQESHKWMRARLGIKYNVLDILGLMFQVRSLRSPHAYVCSHFCTEGLLATFGAPLVLNVLAAWAYRITPETLHLSPIFVGRLVRSNSTGGQA